MAQGDNQESQLSPGVTSPVKTKRNSALIEKLQASLSHPPSGQVSSPKSPGFGLLPFAFTPSSPSSATVTTVTTPLTVTPTSGVTACPVSEEEGPASFEDAPADGSILLSMNKSRARHSIRRRPPSRRHRKSSSGDGAGVSGDVINKTTTTTRGGGGGGEREEVFEKEGKSDKLTTDKTNTCVCPGEDQPKTGEEDEGGRSSSGGQEKEDEGGRSSSGGQEKEEEERNQREEEEEK
ncbi:duboraya isoform X2 [Echeneis naucrates]|nr:capZ-interacting protein-like isoform X2 [Echeneis naucrates]XP_029374557.1 capZ-interacting protein-like isoform X2 [Echeneis naucrates]